MSINHLLEQYAIESGEIAAPIEPEAQVTVAEVVAEHAPLAGETTLPDELAHAEKAEAIADQLDELADRAEELASEDKAYLDQVASTESLHREYGAVMRANQINLPAESFEAAHTDKGRLAGIATDARKAARISRSFADQALDFSAEGKILQFLRRDEAKLAHAGSALRTALHHLNDEAVKVKANPVAIKHNGIARFMHSGGKPVRDLGAAIHADVAWLNKAAKYIDEAQHALTNIAKGGSGHVPSAAGLAVTGGGLLGEHSVIVGSKEKDGIEIPTFSYKSEHKLQVGAAVGSYIVSSLDVGGMVFLGGLAVGAAVPAFANAMAADGAVTKAVQHASNAAVIHNTVSRYDEKVNQSNLVSAAGYNDMVKSIQDVLALDSHLKLKLDDDAFASAVASSEKKAALKAAYGSLAHLADVVYEHAYYLTISMGTVAEKVAREAK